MSRPTIVPVDLERLGCVLLRGLPLRPGDPAHLVHVRLPDGGGTRTALLPDDDVELGVACLDRDEHPLDALVGIVAPPEWDALGVVSVGTVRQAADATLVGTRVRTVQLVERGGAWMVAFAPAVAEEPVAAESGPGGPGAPDGLVDDAIRRALGLPTPEPRVDTLLLFTLQWLDRLVDEATALTIAERAGCGEAWARSRHPAVEALGTGPVDHCRLVAEGRRLATWRDWPQLRRMCAAGAWNHPEIGPAAAAWLDDGAFSRWSMACWPAVGSLLGVLDALLPARTASVVRRSVDAWHGSDDLDQEDLERLEIY